MALLAPACDRSPISETPSSAAIEPQREPGAEDAPASLDDCPTGDRVWARAIRQAMAAGTLEDLRTRAVALTAACADRWEPWWTVGECLLRDGERDASLDAFRQAWRLAETVDDATGMAASGYRLGWLAYRAGDLTHSERHYLSARQAAQATTRDDLQAQVLNGLAGLYLATGRLSQSHETLGQASEALQRAGLAQQARRLALNRAIVILFLGDATAARRILEPLHEASIGDDDDYVAHRSALTLGNLFRRLADHDAARDWYDKVPESAPELAGLARLSLGRIALDAGRADDARRELDQARRLVDPRDRVLVDAFLAEVDLRAGRAAEAALTLREVIAEADRVSADETAWIARRTAAEAALALDDRAAALRLLRQAVDIVERLGETLDPFAEGLRFLRERSEPFVDLAATLCGPGLDASEAPAAAEILTTVEKVHARALRRVLGGADAPRATALADVQDQLQDDELLLDFAIGSDRGVVVAVRRDALRVRQVPGWRELAAPLARYRAALVRPLRSAEARLDPMADLDRSLADGRHLSRALLGPVAKLLTGVRRIFVVPDRQLSLLPTAALPWPPDGATPSFLGQSHEVAVLPLAGVPERFAAGSASPLLLAGDPLPDPEGRFPALPRAAEELASVSALWRADEVTLLERDALTSPRLEALDLSRFGTIHLTTHAVASTADPTRCAVYLSGGQRLGFDVVAGLSLGSPLVVLSACRTGEGELVPGEGVVGLAWAFLRSGARAVTASLWNVDDDAATELMIGFHRRLRAGEDAVSALAGAGRELARHRPHPAYWSAFVVVLRPVD